MNVERGGTLVQDIGRAELDLAPHRPQLGTFGRHRVTTEAGHRHGGRARARPSTTSTPTTTRASPSWARAWSSPAAPTTAASRRSRIPSQPFCMAVLWHPEEARGHERRPALPRARGGRRRAQERRPDRCQVPRGTRGRSSSGSQSARCSSQMCCDDAQAGRAVERARGDRDTSARSGLAPEQARAAAAQKPRSPPVTLCGPGNQRSWSSGRAASGPRGPPTCRRRSCRDSGGTRRSGRRGCRAARPRSS